MVYPYGHSPGATEGQGICQAGFQSMTLQREIDHIMVASCRMGSLNDALPKCQKNPFIKMGSPWPADAFNVTAIQMPFLLVVVVHRIHDIFLAVLDDPPDGATEHVACRQGGDDQTLAFPLQLDRLVVFQLSDLLKAGVDFVQREQVKLLDVMPRLQKKTRVNDS